MAFLRPLIRRCDVVGCPKRAAVELVNNCNAGLGVFCLPHGRTRLREQKVAEDRAYLEALNTRPEEPR